MNYLLDTNFIINVVENKNTDRGIECKDMFSNIVKAPEAPSLFSTELVRVECLRTIPRTPEKKKKFTMMSQFFIDNVAVLELNREIYDKAIDFSRYCGANGYNLSLRNGIVDLTNFIISKEKKLILLCSDIDNEILESHWRSYKSSIEIEL